MVTTGLKPARFELTQRIRTGKKFASELETRLALIDRIAELPGIDTIERTDSAMPCQVDLYLRRDSTRSLREQQAAQLFCGLSLDGLGRSSRSAHRVNLGLAKISPYNPSLEE